MTGGGRGCGGTPRDYVQRAVDLDGQEGVCKTAQPSILIIACMNNFQIISSLNCTSIANVCLTTPLGSVGDWHGWLVGLRFRQYLSLPPPVPLLTAVCISSGETTKTWRTELNV